MTDPSSPYQPSEVVPKRSRWWFRDLAPLIVVLVLTFGAGTLFAQALPHLEGWVPSSWLERTSSGEEQQCSSCQPMLPFGLPATCEMKPEE